MTALGSIFRDQRDAAPSAQRDVLSDWYASFRKRARGEEDREPEPPTDEGEPE